MTEEQKQQVANSAYEDMAELNPPINIEPPSNGGNGNGNGGSSGGSFKSRMNANAKMSDFQTLDKRLFPELVKETVEWLNNLMVARVFPETLLPLKRIVIKHLLKSYPEMSVTQAICVAEVAVGVPLDSEGRIDLYKAYVGGHEESSSDDKSKEL